MKNKTQKEAFVYTVSLLLVLLFVYAAVNKLLDFEHFKIEIGQSPLLSAFTDQVAIAVPLSELLFSLLLLTPRTRLAGLYLSFSLMVMFTTYILIILNWSSFIPCSCGGILSELGWTEHLIFNMVFIILALAGIIIHTALASSKDSIPMPSRLFKKVITILFLSISCIVSLYFLSEKEIHRNNGFVRRYPHHPVKKISGINIKYNSYYIAGYADGKFYLGNTSAPLHMLVADTMLSSIRPITLKVADGDTTRVSAVQVSVESPYFYLADGTVPLLYRGSLDSLVASPLLANIPNYSHLELMTYNEFVIRSLDSDRNTHILGKIAATQIPTNAPKLIQPQGNIIFDTDGMLLYNHELKQVVYVYYYRNEFLIADSNLQLLKRSRTIDTVKQADIKLAYEDSGRIRTLAEQPTMVNKKSATSGRYLFVKSDRLGRHEPEEMLKYASIVDVYDLIEHTYEFSFYLYHHNTEPIKRFAVYGNLLVGLSEHYIVLYRLEKEFFKKYNKIKTRVSIPNIQDIPAVSGEDRKPERE